MAGNVRSKPHSRKAIRFSESPLTVYDLEEWDPFDGFVDDDDNPFETHLDLDIVREFASETAEVAEKYSVPRRYSTHLDRVEGEEVGDDRVDFTLDPLRACSVLVAQEQVCRMVTSQPDTNLSTRLWNFCEVTSHVPLHPYQSFDWCRKTGKFEDLGFVDVPPLRILLDVMKGDRSHSSTSVGKATMLGSRMRTPRTQFLPKFHLASYLQDGLLRTSRSTEPKYLPQIMGGSGVRACFSNPKNLHLSVYAYRGGQCQRIYGSATRELRQSLTSLEKGEVIMPILCRKLRDRQEYLHGTYAAKIFIPTREYKTRVGETLPMPLLTASGGANLFSSFENRLIRTRHAVTATNAEREWEFTRRIRETLMSRYNSVPLTTDLSSFNKKRARSEFGDALNANTALSNLLNRKGSIEDVIALTNDNFHVVNCGATHFSKWDAEWLFFGGKSENFSIEDLTSSEDLYLRTDVSEDESLRVGGILLSPVAHNVRPQRTTTSIGLYQIGSGMYEWAEDLTSRLVQSRDRLKKPLSRDDALLEYEKDPEWVNDDTLIIARCRRDTAGRALRSTTVMLVSADKRLGHQLSNTCNVQVIRVSPSDYIQYTMDLGLSPLTEVPGDQIAHVLKRPMRDQSRIEQVYVDTGSVNAFLSKVSAHVGNGVMEIHEPVLGSYHPKTGKRTFRYIVRKTDPVPNTIRHVTHMPVLMPKRYRTSPGLLAEKVSTKSNYSRSSAYSKSWRIDE